MQKQDTGHSLFWRAWRNSGIEAKLAARDPDHRFTLFLPGNAAMEAAGWNASGISRASKQELDHLVSFHVTPVQLIPGAVALQTGNIELETMLLEPDHIVMRRGSGLTYGGNAGPFRYDLGIVEGQVRINNRLGVGMASESAVLRKASIFPINGYCKSPAKVPGRCWWKTAGLPCSWPSGDTTTACTVYWQLAGLPGSCPYPMSKISMYWA